MLTGLLTVLQNQSAVAAFVIPCQLSKIKRSENIAEEGEIDCSPNKSDCNQGQESLKWRLLLLSCPVLFSIN